MAANSEQRQNFYIPDSKPLFRAASLDLWHLYKQSQRACEASYLQGKEDAFEEVLKYLTMVSRSSDFRFVPISDFITFIQGKYSSHRFQVQTQP